jgi:hypothetical protein
MSASRDPADFWSRRKARVAEEAEADRAAEAAAEAGRARAELEEKTDEEILAELDLKDPDTLEPGDDFAAFLRAEVPDRLRRRALRRLWRSNAVLANLDRLVDYGEDYTDSARVVENLQTAYRVGKGMLSHVLAEEEKATRAEQGSETAGAAEQPPAVASEPAGDAGDTPAPEPGAESAPEPQPAPSPEHREQVAGLHEATPAPAAVAAEDVAAERGAMPQQIPSRRRMKFSYTEAYDAREGA